VLATSLLDTDCLVNESGGECPCGGTKDDDDASKRKEGPKADKFWVYVLFWTDHQIGLGTLREKFLWGRTRGNESAKASSVCVWGCWSGVGSP
jgi:hypothetical protein